MPRGCKVENAWESIFEKYNILQEIDNQGIVKITADQIKEFYEPRLITKFDFSKTRPPILKNNELGILPIDNGTYVIGKFNLYMNLKEIKSDPEVLNMPPYIETIDPDNIYSEANALHVALLTGMLDEVIGESLVQSISGRMRANGFSFTINSLGDNKNIKIDVTKPQIEIDGGYEGEHYVVVVEAKNKIPKDFIVRQLYYPYRYWSNKVSKPVIPLFFVYDSGIYTIYKFHFKDLWNYNSLELLEAKRFVVRYPGAIEKIKQMCVSLTIIKELPQSVVPFPQADSFTRIVDIMYLLDENFMSAREVAEKFEFDIRQGNYYISAGIYLELFEKVSTSRSKYRLTQRGEKILCLNPKLRNIELARQILKHKVFNKAFKYYCEHGSIPSNELICNYIRSYTDLNKKSTIIRRTNSVSAWINWIINSNF